MIAMEDISILIAILFPRFGRYLRKFVENSQFIYNHIKHSPIFLRPLLYLCHADALSSTWIKFSFLVVQSIHQLNLDFPSVKSSFILKQRIHVFFSPLSSYFIWFVSCHAPLFKYYLTLWLIDSYIFLRDVFSLNLWWLNCRHKLLSLLFWNDVPLCFITWNHTLIHP